MRKAFLIPSIIQNRTSITLLEEAAAKNPGGTATLFFGARLSYARLLELAESFAGALSSLGVKKGDRVALILPNLPAYPIVHFAVLRLGGILVPTNPLYVERELERQLSSSGTETVVILDQLYPRLERVRTNTPVRRIVVTRVPDFLPPVLVGALSSEEPVRAQAVRGRRLPIPGSDPTKGIEPPLLM